MHNNSKDDEPNNIINGFTKGYGLTNYTSIILGIINGFSSTSIVGNNGRPNWQNFGGTTTWQNHLPAWVKAG